MPELPEAPALFTVADQLGAAIAARLADAKFQLAPKLAKKDREAIPAFYALGDFKPLWLKDEAWTPAALAVAARLGKAARTASIRPTTRFRRSAPRPTRRATSPRPT